MNRLPRSRGVPRWLALVLVASLLAPSLVAAQAALEATFADLKGEVEWSAAGSTQFQSASLNTVLHAGDRIRTAANSAARLAYFEGSATQRGRALSRFRSPSHPSPAAAGEGWGASTAPG